MLSVKDIILDDFNPQSVAKKIAGRMRRRRLFLNITQKELAEKSGVSLGSIKRFENKYRISLQHLLQLALVLDSLDEFNSLLRDNEYKSIDEIVRQKKVKERKRARNV